MTPTTVVFNYRFLTIFSQLDILLGNLGGIIYQDNEWIDEAKQQQKNYTSIISEKKEKQEKSKDTRENNNVLHIGDKVYLKRVIGRR